jgi:hypothetical protein
LRQVVKAQVFGCACCLRADRLDGLLPFPASAYAHDHWISAWAAVNGKVYFLRDALVKYRKHGLNLTPGAHLSLGTIIGFRCRLILQIFIAIFRRAARSGHSQAGRTAT